MIRKKLIMLVLTLMWFIFTACGPSQAELDETATQDAIAMFATQTAEAPTATLTPTITPTPTSTPTDTPTSTPTETPTITPSPTSEINLSPELYPTPAGLSPEGQQAYDNIAHILLTTDELNAIFEVEEDQWQFGEDGPGLWVNCRTFTRPDWWIHTKFFSCVSQATKDFDLETDDIGMYEVIETHESAYSFDYPSKVYAYFGGEYGRYSVDYLVQIDDFVYITGIEFVTPAGASFSNNFGEYEDEMLYETLQIMVARAEANPPEWLDFPPGASSFAGNQFSQSLVDPADLGEDWYIGESDDIYDNDGACRALYHESGPPPVIVNCLATAEFNSLDDQLDFYADRNYVELTQRSNHRYDDPYFIFADYTDNTENGYPRYSISMEKDGVYIGVNFINPYLPAGTELEQSFTPEIDDLINEILQLNLSALEGSTEPSDSGTPTSYDCDDPLGCVTYGPGDPIQLASALVISGPNQHVGLDSQHGVEVAIEFQDEIIDHSIALITFDDGCSAEGGEIAGQEIVSDPNIIAVIGSSCSGAAVPMSKVISDAGYVMISPSNTIPALTDPDSHQVGYLRTAHNDKFQGEVMAEYAYNVLGVRTAAAVHEGDPYTEDLAQAFIDSYEGFGGQIIDFVAVDKGEDDMLPALNRIAAAGPPEFLYYPVYSSVGGPLTLHVSEIPELEDTILAGADGLINQSFTDAVGQAGEGMYFSGPDLSFSGNQYNEFLQAYISMFGEEPRSVFHAHAFDATNLIFSCIEKVAIQEDDGTLQIGRQAIRDCLFDTQDFQGLTGVLTCDQYGDCGGGGFAVSQLQNGKFEPIWP